MTSGQEIAEASATAAKKNAAAKTQTTTLDFDARPARQSAL